MHIIHIYVRVSNDFFVVPKCKILLNAHHSTCFFAELFGVTAALLDPVYILTQHFPEAS